MKQESEPLPTDGLRESPEAVRPLRVLRLVLSIGPTSAPYNQFTLAAQDHRVTICSFFRPDFECEGGVRVFAGDGSIHGFLRALDQAIAESQYDVVHAHTPHVALMLQIWRLRRWRQPLPPRVLTMHCAFENYRRRNQLMLMPALATFDHVVFCSTSVKESLPPSFHWLRRGPTSIIPNGADLTRIERNRAAGCDASDGDRSEFRIGSVGRLISSKNWESLLAAFARAHASSWRLACFGEGSQLAALRAFSERLSIDSIVEFAGCIPRNELFGRLWDLDVFVSMSYREGLPVSVLEAMACGLPVVLSDIPPHREIAQKTNVVPLIDPDDAASLSSELSRIAAMSPIARRRLGQRCRRVVQQHYSAVAMVSRYDELFRALKGLRPCA